jgi:thiamine pyrophosphate-dependent acetolactate synthase large subunit-like protein
MPRMTGGQAVVAALQANGVEAVFGIPGMHNLAIYDALLDCPSIRHIVARNEQSAAYMANGAGRATGRPGVCLVTTGPGACNTLAGVGDAARESVPMLVIASQIASHYIGQNKGAFHEMHDQMGMFVAAGAWAARANRVEQIPALINAAWVAMTHGRPRPAYVEIPFDVLFAEGEAWVSPAPAAPRPGATPAQIAQIKAQLLAAERPLALVGGGACRAGAGAELARLAERLSLPVASTIHGKGVLPEDHALSAGPLPLGDPACRRLLAESDLLLALGTGFSEVSTHFFSASYPERLIHVDIDGSQIGRTVPASLGIVGDVRSVLAQLNAALADTPRRPASAWSRQVVALPQRLADAVRGQAGDLVSRAMRRLLPRDAIIAGDAASWGGWQIYHFPIYGAGQMLYPIHFGTLGYAIGGAIGAQAVFPSRRAVAVCGDGGFPYGASELATARQAGLHIVVIVVNNGGYATIRRLQTERYGAARVIDADLLTPDFVALARAFGCYGRRAEAPEEFEPALAEALQAGAPAVVEIAFPMPASPTDYGLERARN